MEVSIKDDDESIAIDHHEYDMADGILKELALEKGFGLERGGIWEAAVEATILVRTAAMSGTPVTADIWQGYQHVKKTYVAYMKAIR